MIEEDLARRRREIRLLGWIAGMAMVATVSCYMVQLGSYFGPLASLAIGFAAALRRSRRIKIYNAMILASDPGIEGEHVPIVAQDQMRSP